MVDPLYISRSHFRFRSEVCQPLGRKSVHSLERKSSFHDRCLMVIKEPQAVAKRDLLISLHSWVLQHVSCKTSSCIFLDSGAVVLASFEFPLQNQKEENQVSIDFQKMMSPPFYKMQLTLTLCFGQNLGVTVFSLNLCGKKCLWPGKLPKVILASETAVHFSLSVSRWMPLKSVSVFGLDSVYISCFHLNLGLSQLIKSDKCDITTSKDH